jgi:hypothetical protein
LIGFLSGVPIRFLLQHVFPGVSTFNLLETLIIHVNVGACGDSEYLSLVTRHINIFD